ncbi:MAG TPA: hypothetical protein VE994_18405 [Terriglobales bacterium]|nr:hypothetical protein [Terriglobales bacterium]
MRWRMIGPFRGGRSLTAAGVPGQSDTYYFGAVGGGIWKTTNGGVTWNPIFDAQPIASIGALALAPSNPDIIYAGTGEADMRSDLTFGNGVYKSTDAGRTWTHVGLPDTRHIGRILIDPRNPDVVLVGALGHAYGPNPERGVFRSTDGGQTWTKVLYKDEHTGAIDLAFAPDDPQTVYAALWDAQRPPWSNYPPLEGTGSGIYKSTDGGVTWMQLTGHGLPGGTWGRVGLATGNGKGINRVYALIDQKDEGGLYRSDDAGNSWRRVGDDPRIRERSWYFTGVTVDPADPNVIYLPNVATYRSTDGGKTWTAFKGAPGGDDYHFLWIDPANSRRMILASDQGTIISVDGGKSWSSWFNQPTAQFYHVATDNQFPYFVYGAQQDSGTVATTSRSDYGSITFRDWYSVGGGESGYIAPDPRDPNTVYTGDTYGRLDRFDKTTGQAQDISPLAVSVWGTPMYEKLLRFTWTSPVALSPQDPHVLYFGSQYVLKTSDAGMSWQKISPDLTGASPQPDMRAPLSVANAKARGYGAIYTIAPSPLNAAVIWAGSDTGLIHLTRDGGKTWSNVTPSGLGDWSKISLLEASHFDTGTAYAAVDRHRLDDLAPYIYRTRNYGKTWEKVVNGISAPAFVRAVREDSKRKGLLFAGTELGAYFSLDDGDHWQSLKLNMPTAPVHDLTLHGDDLVIATHGRSFWILDDISPLRQITPALLNSSANLFQPATAIRIRNDVSHETPLPAEVPAGENPPNGAILDYFLSEPQNGGVVLEIRDSQGQLVRTFSSKPAAPAEPPQLRFTNDWIVMPEPLPSGAGMHRFVWDLRYPGPEKFQPSFEIGAIHGKGTPELPRGPLVLPGTYRVRLIVGNKTYEQPLNVAIDPRLKISLSDLQRQFATERQIIWAMQKVYSAATQAVAVRDQLGELRPRVQNNPEVTAALNMLDQRILDVAGSPPKSTVDRNPEGSPKNLVRLHEQLASLLSVVDSADHAPTTQALQALKDLTGTATLQIAAWEQIKRNQLPAFNDLLARNGLPRVTQAE